MLREIQLAWAKVTKTARPVAISTTETTTATVLTNLASRLVDVYDLFLLEAMSNASISQILTDDGDFATVGGIQVFTANQNVLAAARTQGKLLQR